MIEKTHKLCFDGKVFMSDEFSVDRFLSEHKKISNLEKLRDDLGVYLKTLRSSTINLVNENYRDFVNLSTNLSNKNENIDAIKVPMVQIKDQLLVTRNEMNEEILRMEKLVAKRWELRNGMESVRNTIKAERNFRKLLYLLKESSAAESHVLNLERAVTQFNLLLYHLRHSKPEFAAPLNQECVRLRSTLLLRLQDELVSSWTIKDRWGLERCLSAYSALNEQQTVYGIIRKRFVMQPVSDILNENALNNEPDGLPAIYSKFFQFIDQHILQLTRLAPMDVTFKSYDFIINSVWPEVEERLEFHLKSIYSPANPDNFFMCYTSTMNFLDKFEERCDGHTAVVKLRSLDSYKNFINCWNLPVYFTLRFQEIGGNVEKILHSVKSIRYVRKKDLDDEEQWKLSVSEELWNCILRSWDSKIFLRQLSHRFWKFTLQILSRFATWIRFICDSSSIENELPHIDFLIFVHSDGCEMIRRHDRIFHMAKDRLQPNISSIILENMNKCIEESKCRLETELANVENKVTELICEKSSSAIRQVSDIPRLYRRTNRDVPEAPCPYVFTLLQPIHDLIAQQQNTVCISRWINPILSNLTRMYYDQVFEVLTSVQKTEESLKKFKKYRDPSIVSDKTNTDDDKIRLQLQIDLQSYLDEVRKMTDIPSNVDKLDNLNDLLDSLKKK